MDIHTRKKAYKLGNNISNTLALLGASRPVQSSTGSVYVNFPRNCRLRVSDHYTVKNDATWQISLNCAHKIKKNIFGVQDFALVCNTIKEFYGETK